jgi:hypothetical protein
MPFIFLPVNSGTVTLGKNAMTLNEADKIVQIWGRFIEYMSGKLMHIFGAQIPESFLPYPKDTIEEALNIIAEYHHKAGNHQAVQHLQTTLAHLIMYVDDEEALLQASRNFNNPSWRDAILPRFKQFQEDWIATIT